MSAEERHEYFMEIALQEAREALDAREFPVGCIAVHDDKVVARGRRINSRNGTGSTFTGKSCYGGPCSGPQKQARTANELDHAEINCLRQLNEFPYQVDYAQVTFYSTLEPCLMCYGALLINGIGVIVYSYEDVMGGGTMLDRSYLTPFYRNRQVEIIPFILREKSLTLFKEFFSSPGCSYLNGTYLARYTLGMMNDK
ncbi:MAG: nucleoside deaminase [Thermodesulfobacteriota bacterium]